MRPSLVALATAALAALAACGGQGAATSSTTGPLPQADVVVVAKDLKYDTAKLKAVAGKPLVVLLDNQDEGVNHNIHFSDVPGSPATSLENGPSRQVITITVADPGTYHYVCDIHTNMKGEIIVS